MSLAVYPLVLYFGCLIILHVFDISAQFPPSDVNAESFRITKFPNQHNVNAFTSNIQPAIPSSFATGLNQQSIYTAFPASTNTASSSSTTAASSLLPTRSIPNAFTRAVLAIPSLQRYFNLRIPRLQAANCFFNVVNDASRAFGSSAPEIIANIVGQGIASLDVFTIPLYFQVEGNAVEKFLISEGIEIVPSLSQSYANSVEKSLESSVLNSHKALIRALLDGFVNFIQSLGFSYAEKSYILALVFSEEVNSKALNR